VWRDLSAAIADYPGIVVEVFGIATQTKKGIKSQRNKSGGT
jgi:hypothetical protein